MSKNGFWRVQAQFLNVSDYYSNFLPPNVLPMFWYANKYTTALIDIMNTTPCVTQIHYHCDGVIISGEWCKIDMVPVILIMVLRNFKLNVSFQYWDNGVDPEDKDNFPAPPFV